MTDKKRSPTNTTAETERDPIRALVTGLPGGIDRQERAGQREIVESDVLPVDGFDEAALAALGFVAGGVVPGDPLFRYVRLPPGWTRVATDHAMWSKIADEAGCERIDVFYKAAYYDRRAFMRFVPGASQGKDGTP